METLSPAPQEDGSGAAPSSVKSDDSTPPPDSGRGSPPPNCAICLGTCRNKCFTDSCLHQFCFKCLLTWSKVKAECPLCKQNFKSIIHNVRSNHQYEEYLVEQRAGSPDPAVDLSGATRRFRYRTTLTLPRSNTLAIQHLLMHYPMMAGVLPPAAPAPAPRRRRSPASFRRTVYRHNLWARPLPDFTGRYRDCSPEFYRRNDSQMHRLVPWLNRELHYLLNENVGHISYVMARILELLQRYHINSAEFSECLRRYFGERTDHFLHELYCFASTPYDMSGYDRHVQYTTDTRISTIVDEVISSTDSDASVDSDIVMVSSSGPAEPPAGPSRPAAQPRPAPGPPGPAYPPDRVIPIETLSRSGSDDDDEEVVVVGYIKPPAERTPEVVDLVGSDSDIVVHEPEPAPAPAPDRLVKLSLRRPRPAPSDSDDNYVPPPRRRRRRDERARARAAPGPDRDSDSGSDSASTRTPSPPPPTPAPAPAPAPEPCESEPEAPRRRRSPKRSRRKAARRRARRAPSPSPSPARSRSRSVSGSRSGSPARSPPSPGPSSGRRLRSVVTVPRPSPDSSSSGANLLSLLSSAILAPRSAVLAYNGEAAPGPSAPAPVPRDLLQKAESCFGVKPEATDSSSGSDPEDDLPLNLSVSRARPL